LLLATAKRPQIRTGTYNCASGDGRVHWKPDDEQRLRIRTVTITEKEAVEQGLPRWK
jgi:hypothetical protein